MNKGKTQEFKTLIQRFGMRGSRILIVTICIALSFIFGTNTLCVHAATDIEKTSEQYQVPDYVAMRILEAQQISREPVIENEENFPEIPLFNQLDFENYAYGDYGTIASHGCGIVSLSMVSTYLTDSIYAPDYLAEMFGSYNTKKGSYWILFKDSAEKLNIPFVDSGSENAEWYDWDKVYEALENRQPVICLQHKGMFTNTGHFIVLTGLTEDGKILVNDPYGYNWTKNNTMKDGFKNGFTAEQIKKSATAYWIYGEKTLEAAQETSASAG